MKKLLTILLLAFSIQITAQVHLMHDFYYFVNPEHESKVYKNVLVISSMGVKINKKIKRIAGKMKYTVTFYEDLFPPIKEYTQEDIQRICDKAGVDAVIYYTYLGSEETGTSLSKSSGNVFLVPGNGLYSYNTTTKQQKYFKMSITFLDMKDMKTKQYFCTGGYGPEYSTHVGVQLFRASLKVMKKKKIVLTS